MYTTSSLFIRTLRTTSTNLRVNYKSQNYKNVCDIFTTLRQKRKI